VKTWVWGSITPPTVDNAQWEFEMSHEKGVIDLQTSKTGWVFIMSWWWDNGSSRYIEVDSGCFDIKGWRHHGKRGMIDWNFFNRWLKSGRTYLNSSVHGYTVCPIVATVHLDEVTPPQGWHKTSNRATVGWVSRDIDQIPRPLPQSNLCNFAKMKADRFQY